MPASVVPRRYENPPIALTFDLEEWFCVCGEDYYGDPRRWESFEPRAASVTEGILGRLAAGGHRATFFVLGWLARRNPALIREIAGAGHEIGFHTMTHRRRTELRDEDFRTEVRDGRRMLEDLSGTPVAGFRAAEWSIRSLQDSALPILAEEGYRYDSSVTPVPVIGGTGNDPYPSELVLGEGRRLAEFPPLSGRAYFTTVLLGGTWAFRSVPYSVVTAAVERFRRAGAPAIFAFHPWEMDPVHPPMSGLSALARLAHFGRWANAGKRFARVLSIEPTSALADLL